MVSARVDVAPAFFPWAVERARGDWDEFARRFPMLPAWQEGRQKPTLKQLEKFASATHAPIGFFFLPEPPLEILPLRDFRTVGSAVLKRPSAALLDTIHVCQERQDWYRDFARQAGMAVLAFVGSASLEHAPARVAAEIATALGFSLDARRACSSADEAARYLVSKCEEHGILVMVSGVVGNNAHRLLDPEEFRGFCLVDALAPLVFVNGSDSKSAQMFTLMHEVAHLWLGAGGVSNVALDGVTSLAEERWCNAVAAEVLVPLAALAAEYDARASVDAEVERIARLYKVSRLVVIRRLLDAGLLAKAEYNAAYGREMARLAKLEKSASGGGDFYRTEAVRVSKRFATALLVSTHEGYTLFRDAARLLGIKKVSTLNEFASRMGVS